MRKVKRIGIGLIMLITVVWVLIQLNKNTVLLWNSNTIRVTADKPLITHKVKIEFGISVFSGRRKSEEDFFRNRERYTIVYNGKAEKELINDYGENDFLVTYDNQYYYAFRHIKLNHKHQHEYNFHVYQQQDGIMLRVEIKGEDDMKLQEKMKRIDEAYRYE